MATGEAEEVQQAAARGRSSTTPGDRGDWPEGADPVEDGVTTADEVSVDTDPVHGSPQGDSAGVPVNTSDPSPGTSEATPTSGAARDA